MSNSESEVKAFLKDFGLTDKEISVYLALLKKGPSTVMNLARETGIKRSTTHNTVEELIARGFVSQTNYGERRMAVAESPEKLKFLIEQKRWELNRLDGNIDNVVSAIYEVFPKVKNNVKVNVKYYIGKAEVEYVYNLAQKAEKVYSFVNIDKFQEIYPKGIETFYASTKKNSQRKLAALVIDSPTARKVLAKQTGFQFKFIPETQVFEGIDILIFEDSLAIIQLERDNTTAVFIESKLMANSLLSIHQLVWGSTK